MKITLTGSLGNIGKPLAEILIKNGHNVTVISSDAKKQSIIEGLGAKAAIGSVSDIEFLTKAFQGADAIYTMVPPDFGVANYRQYVAQTGKNYQEAIKASGVKRVVNLSSIGAHLSGHTGPIAGLHDVEQTLNQLEHVAVKHLRAGFFYVNLFFDINLIKHQGIMGNNYGQEAKLIMVHPRDIAEAAAQELQGSFKGKSHRYVISDERGISQMVKELGASVGKPELPWVQFTDEEALAGMAAAGMPQALASAYVEMGRAIGSGILWEDFNQHKPEIFGNRKFADFTKEFAAAYQH
jgi:uncharacterized protein YbjT (DUF2867 family)